MKYYFKNSTVYIAIFSILLLTSCVINPVTEKRELSLLSYEKEIRLGVEADKGIIEEYGLYGDSVVREYVGQLGQKMVKVSHRSNLIFRFRVLDSPVINAFALPGGFVYITRGILAYMNSEAELAGVIGHEIGHITARHSAKQYTRTQFAQVGFGLGMIFSEQFRRFSDVAQLGTGLLLLRFSRDQERQSDQLGVEYAAKVGYDASKVSHFFGTLNRLQDLSGQELPGWFSTHPNPEDREEKILEISKEWHKKVSISDFKIERDRYLDLVDGIVFGEDPRQGFVENDVFYHPSLDFQFPVPEGWQLMNSPQEVRIVSKDKGAAMLFTISHETDARRAARKYINDSQGLLIHSDFDRVNGMNAEIRVTDFPQQQGTVRALSYFIEKGDKVYVFHGFCSAANYRKNFRSFRYTMTNFDRIRNRAIKDIEPTQVKVVKVHKGETLKDVLEQFPSSELTIEQLAILNGMELTDTIEVSDRIKVLTN